MPARASRLQNCASSSARSTRSLALSLLGGLTMWQGLTSRTSRLIAQLNILRTTSRVLLAWMGAPRATIRSSRAITSRRRMSLALRWPQRGKTSLRRIRSSSSALRFLGRAHFWRYSSVSSSTVSAVLSARRAVHELGPGVLAAGQQIPSLSQLDTGVRESHGRISAQGHAPSPALEPVEPNPRLDPSRRYAYTETATFPDFVAGGFWPQCGDGFVGEIFPFHLLPCYPKADLG